MTDFRIVERAGHDRLGEGPTWIAASGQLFWVDIVSHRLWSLTLESGTIRHWDFGEPIGWVVERAGRTDMLAGLKSGICSVSLDPFAVLPLVDPEPDRPHNRLNDAKVDAQGRLWLGSKDDRDLDASGALYRYDPAGTPVRVDDGYRVTNGPTFSPDGRHLYHTDSGLGCVYRFDVDAGGHLSDRQPWLQFPTGWGFPDGMTTDAEGHVWIAHWGGGRISRFDPEARLVRSIALPATNITSCAFAGPALDRLFVTSAALDTDGAPAQGALFEIDPGVTGLPATPFAA